MSVSTIIRKNHVIDPKPFPKIMRKFSKTETTLVYFRNSFDEVGLVLYTSNQDLKEFLFCFRAGFNQSEFVDFNDEIILQND